MTTYMTTYLIRPGALVAIALAAACSPDQRQTLDSAAGVVDSAASEISGDVRAELSVVDIDIGRRAGPENEVDEEVETFARSDTIYASVSTLGTVRQGAITSQWIFPDSSVLDQEARPVTQDRDADLLFFLTRPGGLEPGKYTFRVLVDGRDVRSQEVTVR